MPPKPDDSSAATPKEPEAPPAKSEPAEPEPAGGARSKSTSPPARRPLHNASEPVMIISSPGGATTTMDGRIDTSCKTPCSIEASPGRHTVVIAMPGYQMERRDVDVGSSPMELPAIMLRSAGGTLMLTSVPPGASVLVDGRPVPQVTPAQIQLSPGTHKITVAKDGLENSTTVEMGTGISRLRIPLAQ